MSAEPWEVAGGAPPSSKSSTPEPWEVAATPQGSVAERLWEGVKGGASRLRDELLPPGNPVHALSMGTVGTDDVPGRKAELAEYGRRLASGELGTAGDIGDVLPEVALTALPIARTGTAIYLLKLVQKYCHLQEPFRNAAAQVGREVAAQQEETQ